MSEQSELFDSTPFIVEKPPLEVKIRVSFDRPEPCTVTLRGEWAELYRRIEDADEAGDLRTWSTLSDSLADYLTDECYDHIAAYTAVEDWREVI